MQNNIRVVGCSILGRCLIDLPEKRLFWTWPLSTLDQHVVEYNTRPPRLQWSARILSLQFCSQFEIIALIIRDGEKWNVCEMSVTSVSLFEVWEAYLHPSAREHGSERDLQDPCRQHAKQPYSAGLQGTGSPHWRVRTPHNFMLWRVHTAPNY